MKVVGVLFAVDALGGRGGGEESLGGCCGY